MVSILERAKVNRLINKILFSNIVNFLKVKRQVVLFTADSYYEFCVHILSSICKKIWLRYIGEYLFNIVKRYEWLMQIFMFNSCISPVEASYPPFLGQTPSEALGS